MELPGVTQRYAGPHLRCLIVGEPTKEVAADAEVCKEMVEAGVSAIRPGTTSHDVDAAVRRALRVVLRLSNRAAAGLRTPTLRFSSAALEQGQAHRSETTPEAQGVNRR